MRPKGNLLDHIFLLLIIAGTYFIIMIPGILELDYVLFTVPLKWLILLYSFLLICTQILIKKKKVRLFGLSFFILFWIVYIARVIFDLYFVGIKAKYFPTSGDYLESIIYCIIPGIALCCIKKIDFTWLLKWSFWVYLIASILSLFVSLDIATEEVQRAEGRYGGTQGLNSIAYGHYGVTLSLISFFLLTQKSQNLVHRLFFIAGFCLGLFVMFLAGSRGPLLALIVCLIFYQVSSWGVIKGVMAFVLVVVPFFIFSTNILDFLSQFGGAFFDRVSAAIESGNATGRGQIFASAFEDFLNNPILGRAFLCQSGPVIGEYPHNLIIESLMATGVIGGFFFIAWVIRAIFKSYELLRLNHKSAWIALLFLQQLIFGMFSLSIFIHDKFWHVSAIVVIISTKIMREKSVQVNRAMVTHLD